MSRKPSALTICCALILLIQVWAASAKMGYHCDEGYTFMLTSLKLDSYYETIPNATKPLWLTGDWIQNLVRLDPKDHANYRALWHQLRWDGHPPFYYLVLHHIQHWTGGELNKWQGLSLNIVCNLLCLPLLYSLGAELFPNSRWPRIVAPAIWGTALIALDLTVFIRQYILLATLSTLTVWILVRWERQRDRGGRYALAFFATVTLGSLTQYLIIPWCAFLILFFLPRWHGQKKACAQLILALAGGFGCCCALFPLALEHWKQSNATNLFKSNAEALSQGDPQRLLNNWRAFRSSLTGGLLYPEVLLLLSVAMLLLIYQRRVKSGRVWGLVLTITAFFVFNLFAAPLPAPRYLAPLLPTLCLLIAGALTPFPPRWQRILGPILLVSFTLRALITPLHHAFPGQVSRFTGGRPEGLIFVRDFSLQYLYWPLFQEVHQGQRYLFVQKSMLDQAELQSWLSPSEKKELANDPSYLIGNRARRESSIPR